MRIINQLSFVIVAGIFFILGAAFLLRDGVNHGRIAGVLGLAIFLSGLWFAFRPRQSPQIELTHVEVYIGGGTPVLLEFQSPY